MKVVFLVLFLAPLHLIATQIEDLISRGVTHLAVVEQLMSLEDTVPALPRAKASPLLVEEAMTIRVLYGECAKTDVRGTP